MLHLARTAEGFQAQTLSALRETTAGATAVKPPTPRASGGGSGAEPRRFFFRFVSGKSRFCRHFFDILSPVIRLSENGFGKSGPPSILELQSALVLDTT